MTYRILVPAEVRDALRRLREADPEGAALVVETVAALAADPRPADAHPLSLARGLHRIHRTRLEPSTGRSLQYRIMYQINDGELVILVVAVGALPRRSRRR